MPTCSAFGCTYKHCRKKTAGKSVHKFPFSRPEVLEQWVQNVRRKHWIPTKRSVLCSDHFESDCFDRTGAIIRLKSHAVPTIFSFPQHLKKVSKTRKAPLQRDFPIPTVINEEKSECLPTTSSSTDHNYHFSPSKLKQKLINQKKKNTDCRKRLKTKQQNIRRLKRKVNSLSDLVNELRSLNLISESATAMLMKSLAPVPASILSRMLNNKKSGCITREKYDPALRSFAMTLQFYSTKAYQYVRETFDLALPHPSCIRKWYSSIHCDPGFCVESFNSAQRKVEEEKKRNRRVVCSLMIDEMSIRKHIEWTGKQFRGYVDLGTDIEDDDVPIASEALVFMIVSLNGSWKIPLAYFLINGLSGEERANLVKECLIRLHNIGVKVSSLTCDGPSVHFSMMKCLGAKIDLADPVPFFYHPACATERVFVIFDICHMLKLLRNTWSSLVIFKNLNGQEISYRYLLVLHELQDKVGLRAGNKLKKQHIQWQNQKMKVNLAAQTISSSVSDALEFCEKDLNMPNFQGCSATVEFIRIFDRLFDLLNSRNALAKGYKAPLRKSNAHIWMPFIDRTLEYIIQLTDVHGLPLYNTPRKTPFIGFYISTLSVKYMFGELVCGIDPYIDYLLTYKISQDHLELFFCAIRSRGGWNNNPTASQFMSSFKRLLLHNEVKSTNGNVKALDRTQVLFITSGDTVNVENSNIDTLDISTMKKYGFLLDVSEKCPENNTFDSIPNFNRSTEFKENICAYIAGFVTKMAEKKIKCDTCISALTENSNLNSHLKLLLRKTRGGGLQIPSKSVIDICFCTEKYICRVLNATDGNLPQKQNFALSLINAVLEEIVNKPTSPFPTLENHI